MSRSKLNIILVVTAILITLTGLMVWGINSRQSVLTQNALTGQQQLSGGGAPADKGVVSENNYRSTLLSDDTIFKLGLKDEEYQTLVNALTSYTKQTYGDRTAIVYTIDPKSVSYDDSSHSFSFRTQINKGGTQYLSVRVTRVEFNILQIRFSKGDDTVYDKKHKINPLL